MSLMSTRWRWPPLALFAVIDSVQAIDQDMVLYLGCTIGGLVFLLLIVILFILVCKRPNEKPRHSSNSLNSRSGWPVGPVPAQVPPGVWTSNPSMQALRHKHMMLHQPAKLSSHPGHHVNGYANRKPQPVVNSAPKKQAPAPPRLSGEKRSRGHHPTRDKTVREMTLKLEDDERFPQQQNCGIRTSVGTQGDRPNGTAAARIYHSEPCLDGGSPQDPHVAKIYSDYCSKQNKTQSGEERAETNKDVARVFRSFADVSRSTADAEAISPIYAMPHDAITQSDWVLDQSCQQSGVTRSSSHVTPSSLNMVGGRNPYGRGVFMRPSDASQYAHKRPKGDSPRHSGGSRTPVPSQILMYQHLQQQEQLAKTHASAERLSRTETDSRPASAVSRSYSDVADIRHFAPQDDPDAIYTRPMKLKRRSVESKGTPPRIPEESVMLPAGMSPVESPSSPPPPVPPPVALSPIDEGTTQMTVHAVIENHDENSPSDDVRTSPPASPARTTSPDRLSAVLPHDGRTSRRRSVDELTTMSEKHHQGEVMDAFKFLEDFDDVMPSGKD